jgi:hypothetical protein
MIPNSNSIFPRGELGANFILPSPEITTMINLGIIVRKKCQNYDSYISKLYIFSICLLAGGNNNHAQGTKRQRVIAV